MDEPSGKPYFTALRHGSRSGYKISGDFGFAILIYRWGKMLNFRAFAFAFAILLLTPLHAAAVSLSLNGNSADLQNDNTQAVYASDANGVPVLISAIGLPAPGGGVVTEVGVLQLWCVARDGRRWKLEFNVREKVAS